jgi:hypothetical protein
VSNILIGSRAAACALVARNAADIKRIDRRVGIVDLLCAVSGIAICNASSGSGWRREMRRCYACDKCDIEEARMSLCRAIAGAFLVIAFASCARAEDRRQGGGTPADPAPTRARVLTGKGAARSKMDGRAAHRQLQRSRRQARQQAAAQRMREQSLELS